MPYSESNYVEAFYFDGQGNVVPKNSLNGNHCTFVDGQSVLVNGIVGRFFVISSFFFKSDIAEYMVMYVLTDKENKISIVPSTLVYLEKKDDSTKS